MGGVSSCSDSGEKPYSKDHRITTLDTSDIRVSIRTHILHKGPAEVAQPMEETMDSGWGCQETEAAGWGQWFSLLCISNTDGGAELGEVQEK